MKLTDEFEARAGIYIIKCLVNGKYYVGESVNLKRRIREHRSKLKNPLTVDFAIKKYGVDNFEIYVEYFPNFKKKNLHDLEEQLIIKFNSLVPNGYNVKKYGGNPHPFKGFSEETRLKLSQAAMGNKSMSGKRHSKETKAKMAKAARGNTRGLGSKRSEDHKRKISESKLGIPRTKEHRMKMSENQEKFPIAQINKKTLETIRVWSSAKEAERHLSIDDSSIGNCAKGKSKSAGGFKWEYLPR